MPDCPDRETLETQMSMVRGLKKHAQTGTEFGIHHEELCRLKFYRDNHKVLSDPDWRAWLGKIQNPEADKLFFTFTGCWRR